MVVNNNRAQTTWLLRIAVILTCASYALAGGGGNGTGIVIFKAEFHHVAKPFVVCAWVLAASIAKISTYTLFFIRTSKFWLRLGCA